MATETQTGNGHKATVEQNAGTLNKSYDNQATIMQAGTTGGHTASVQQSNNSSSNKASVDQSGTIQNAFVEQVGGAWGSSTGNIATVKQTGVGNTGTVLEHNISQFNTADLTQSGSGNYGEIRHVDGATYNKATVTQSGTNGKAITSQFGGESYAEADIKQSGTSNEAYIEQWSGSGNKATVDQLTSGGGNYAYLGQGDFTFTGGLSNDNTALATQRGSNNSAQLTQKGNLNKATISQTGDGNIVGGIVGGGYGQDYLAKQIGNSNTLTISQTSALGGPGMVASVQQVGIGNGSTITQSNN